MRWFQVDTDAPNDPKLKVILRRGLDPNRGQAAAGAVFLLWCYIANHGNWEPGVGVRSDGAPLSLLEMSSECWFDDVPALIHLLDALADLGHIHPKVWHQKQVVFLPAMWERTSAYYRSKARKMEYQSAKQIVDVLLADSAHGGPIRPGSAPTNQPTDPPDKQDQPKSVGRSHGLLADAGADQVAALVQVWNDERKPGPLVQPPVSATRRRAMQKALHAHPNLDDWRKVIRYINGQDWCNAKGSGDHVNWRADIDYLIRPGKMAAALERLATDQKHGAAADGTVGRDASRGRTGAKPGEFAQALKDDDQ